ncbi:MAG: hypothetical protein JW751_26015 [Polyangiaceae bacterium]|nr:hypothetical protein [Polyangiaceae bacterium]
MRQWLSPLVFLGTLTLATPASRAPLLRETEAAVEVLAPIVREIPDSFLVPLRGTKQDRLHVYFPASCAVGTEVDLILHFHGHPPALARALSESGVNAVLAVENLGVISRDYANIYSVVGVFDDLLRRALALLKRGCPDQEYRVRRIALSAWSAGYAAVGAILANPEYEARTDAILLSDGLHSGFMVQESRQLPPSAIRPFVAFAQKAVTGRRLMAITHTAIETREYASTTETTSFLLAELGVERVIHVPPVPRGGMSLESEASLGKLTVEGYGGGDEAAHAAQLHSMAQTLFTPLRNHWESTAPPPSGSGQASAGAVSVTVEVTGNQLCTQVGTHVECRPAI